MIIFKKLNFNASFLATEIRPDNEFGRILNQIARFLAIFGGFVLLNNWKVPECFSLRYIC